MKYKAGGELNGWEQYQICKERGHTDSNIIAPSNPPWNICKYCGTRYRYENKLVESGIPRNPQDD